jgi:hypothetical protein
MWEQQQHQVPGVQATGARLLQHSLSLWRQQTVQQQMVPQQSMMQRWVLLLLSRLERRLYKGCRMWEQQQQVSDVQAVTRVQLLQQSQPQQMAQQQSMTLGLLPTVLHLVLLSRLVRRQCTGYRRWQQQQQQAAGGQAAGVQLLLQLQMVQQQHLMQQLVWHLLLLSRLVRRQ